MLLLLAALLVRAAIPQGYMIESDEAGRLGVVVCHSDIVWQIPLEKKHRAHDMSAHGTSGHDMGGTDKAGHDKSGHGDPQPCAFAVAGTATPPPEIAPLPLPAAVVEEFTRTQAPFALASADRQLPPARAPPARV